MTDYFDMEEEVLRYIKEGSTLGNLPVKEAWIAQGIHLTFDVVRSEVPVEDMTQNVLDQCFNGPRPSKIRAFETLVDMAEIGYASDTSLQILKDHLGKDPAFTKAVSRVLLFHT
ncbi:MAG: hypothetical protein HPY73_02760 [Methanomassiliicoccales archaeon]|nr:MAG: hypothetical protein HPY73_02760 [Methanomassiliicoccales archaeon]